jgi:uncharacterized protein involved in tellurium resistance
MARTLISIDVVDDWVTLGDPGQSTVTIQKVGQNGRLLLNTAQVENTAAGVTPNRLLAQFSNNSATDQLFAKATTDGWEIIFDQE